MKPLVPLAAVLLAAAAQAQPAPVRPAQLGPAQLGQGGPGAMRKYPGVSDAGNAILAEALNAPDPQLSTIVRQQRALHDAFVAAAMAPTIDLDKVQALMKQREDLQAQFRQRGDERLLAAMRQLPIADRGPFMRALVAPPAPR